jgi:hypothetical protein
MKYTFLALAFAAVGTVAGSASATEIQPGVVTVSCWHGPWQAVIWDRPNPVFVESLIAVGYDYPNAYAIAQRICRDPEGVGRPDYLKAEMEKVLGEAPMWKKPRAAYGKY